MPLFQILESAMKIAARMPLFSDFRTRQEKPPKVKRSIAAWRNLSDYK
jgi:hypothetical protein